MEKAIEVRNWCWKWALDVNTDALFDGGFCEMTREMFTIVWFRSIMLFDSECERGEIESSNIRIKLDSMILNKVDLDKFEKFLVQTLGKNS